MTATQGALFQYKRMESRYYQDDAVRAIFDAFESNRSTLLHMATGLGKTQVFCTVAEHWDGYARKHGLNPRVLVLAHRDELVEQARRRLENHTGEFVQIEQAQWAADHKTRLVVGSIDTVKQKRGERYPRMERLGDFGLIICDEFHHYVAKTYRRPLDHYQNAKILGVTATPDRGDRKALGQICDEVAYTMDIQDGINAGYLAPIEAYSVLLKELDMSDVKTVAGDLHQGQLEEKTLNACELICQHVVDHEPERQGLLFFPRTKSAHFAAERLNVLKPGSAMVVDGKTPLEERRALVRGFKRGDYQYLCNCQVATEGFDAPNAAFVVPKLTKSRGLYTQMVGRATRPEPGVVDGLPLEEQAEARRAAIAASAKPTCTILDFCGNAGAHSLISPFDLLDGNYSEAVVRRAKQKQKLTGGDLTAMLEAAKAELQAIAKANRGRMITERRKFSPFDILRLDPDDIDHRKFRFAAHDPATKAQRTALTRFGVREDNVEGLTKAQASALLDKLVKRARDGLCTYNQKAALEKWGYDAENVGFDAASAAIGYLKRTGPNHDPARVYDLMENA